ncbi:MAG: LysR family transcriptional regulator [Hungatella sp.]|nr:LysR family transcriptional regulator [Hungatella sp.]
MTLQQLRYLISICETGSMLAAAEAMYVSQSTLSCSLKKLEKELSVILFNRTSKGLELTEAGLILKKHAEIILGDVKEAEQELHDFADLNSTLVIGLSSMVSVSLWPRLYSFAQKELFPVMLETVTGSRRELLPTLNQGKLAGYICTLDTPKVQANEYELIKIGTAPPLVFCVSEKNPLARKESVTYGELFSLPLVRLKGTGRQHIEGIMGLYDCTPNYIQYCDQISTLIRIISDDLAAGFLNIDLLEGYSGIKMFPLKDLKPADYYLIFTSQMAKQKNFKAFMKMVKKFSVQ